LLSHSLLLLSISTLQQSTRGAHL